MIPELSAAWLHDFDIDDRPIIASFTGFPGAPFTVIGQDIQRNGAVLGAGMTYMDRGAFTASLNYYGELRGDYKSHGIYGLLKYRF